MQATAAARSLFKTSTKWVHWRMPTLWAASRAEVRQSREARAVCACCCRSLRSQHASTVQQQLADWHQQEDVSVLAAEAEKAEFVRGTAWQLVQLAERVVEFRTATGGQAVPLADWRAWLSLFLAGAPPLVPARPPTTYLHCQQPTVASRYCVCRLPA
jgi:hypothetical protein